VLKAIDRGRNDAPSTLGLSTYLDSELTKKLKIETNAALLARKNS